MTQHYFKSHGNHKAKKKSIIELLKIINQESKYTTRQKSLNHKEDFKPERKNKTN